MDNTRQPQIFVTLTNNRIRKTDLVDKIVNKFPDADLIVSRDKTAPYDRVKVVNESANEGSLIWEEVVWIIQDLIMELAERTDNE